MSERNYTESLELDLRLIIRALQCRSKSLIEFCQNTLNCIKGGEYAKTIFSAALLEVYESEPDTFDWIVENLYDLETYTEWLDDFVFSIVQKLIQKKFVIGQDFSLTCTRKIIVTKKLKASLARNSSKLDRFLLKKILIVLE